MEEGHYRGVNRSIWLYIIAIVKWHIYESRMTEHELSHERYNFQCEDRPWEAVAGGYLARAYVGVERKDEAQLVLDECWLWRQS